jgi:hypothetical protein
MSLKVFHENFGIGQLINGMHSQPDAEGYIEYYDVMFEHGIEQNVSAEELEDISEKLIGKQKNIDANHNGRIDAEDFKILKKKKTADKQGDDYKAWRKSNFDDRKTTEKIVSAKNEETELTEKLTKDMSAADIIDDFVHSDDPKFAGKSKEERKKMALGAYYSMHPEKSTKEGFELDEARGRPKKTQGETAQRSPMEGLMAAADAMEAGAPVTFRDGNTHTVKKEHAKAALLHMARKNQTHDMPDPGAKDRQAACLHSHESMLKAIGVKEEVGLSYEEAAQLIEHFEKAYASGLITEEELQEIKKSTLRKIGRVAAGGLGGALLGAGIATMPALGLPAAAAALKASGLGTGMMVGLAHHNDHKAAEDKKDAAEKAKKKEEKEKKSMQSPPVTEMTYEEALEILEQAYELGLISENDLNELYVNTDKPWSAPKVGKARPMIGDPPERPNPLHMTPEEIKKHKDAIKKIGPVRHVIGDPPRRLPNGMEPPPKPSPNHVPRIKDRTIVRYNESSNKFRSNPMAEIVNEGKMKDAIKKAGSVIKQVGKEMLGDVKSAPSTVTRSTHKTRGQGFGEAVTDNDRVKAQAKNTMPNDIPNSPEHKPKIPPASKKSLGSVEEKGVNESVLTSSSRNKAVEEAVLKVMQQNRSVRAEAKHADNVRRGLVTEEPGEE